MKNLKRINALIIVMVMLFVSIGATVNVEAATIRLNKKSVTLTVGKTTTLKVKGTKKKVTWKSSNKKIVTVTKKGKLKAKKAGKATVYAKVGKKKLKCKVTVKAKATPKPTPKPTVTPLSENWAADSAAAESLRQYVAKVTNSADKENFIPVKDRIAVFDMDGTLTCETYFTYYDTMMFIDFCLNDGYKDYKDSIPSDLMDAAAEIEPGYTAGEELARNFARAYEGMTIDQLYDYAVKFGQKNTSSFNNMRYIDGFYLPMVELVKYLYDNDFTIYVVSGTERTTTRAIVANSPIADYVTPNHVIGTEFEVKQKGYETVPSNMDYKYADGDELVFTGGFIQKNLNSNKVIFIEKEIGQRPVLAFGNSGSDTSMMNYAIDSRNKYPAQAYMIIADDNVREWGDPANWEKKAQGYIDMNYVVISMSKDFVKIYPDAISKADTQIGNTEETSGDTASGNAAAADWAPAEVVTQDPAGEEVLDPAA